MKKSLVVTISICLVLIVYGVAVYNWQNYLRAKERVISPISETKATMVKKLPEDIKKQLATATPSATFRVPILLYHYVEIVKNKRDKLRQELTIAPAVFDLQIKTLSDAGYTFMTAKDLADVIDGKMQMPAKPVLLTFDDGHWDVATDILPILQKYHAKATAYIVPGFTGGSDFMTKSQVQTVADSGLVEIGAHTVHHVALKGRPYAVVKNEVDNSKTMLEDEYHVSVVSFAYPYGSFDKQAAQIVQDDGFRTAVTTVPGIEQNNANRYFMYRIRPGARTGQYLLNLLAQSQFKAF